MKRTVLTRHDSPGAELAFTEVYPLLENRLTSVFYHVISDERLPHVRNLYLYRTVGQFRQDLEFFAGRFNFVTFDQVVRHVREGADLPTHPFFISFDDGHREMSDVVGPMMKKMGLPATFFITTATIDDREYIPAHLKSLCIDQINAKSEAEIGNLAADEQFRILAGVITDKRGLLAKIGSIRDYNKEQDLLETLAHQLGIGATPSKQHNALYLSTKQICGLLRDGFHVGAHGHRHLKFQYLAEDERERELRDSAVYVSENFGLSRIGFCFPNSGIGVSEDWMLKMISDYPEVNAFFDTGGFRDNTSMVVNRVTFDEPISTGKSFSDIGPDQILVREFNLRFSS